MVGVYLFFEVSMTTRIFGFLGQAAARGYSTTTHTPTPVNGPGLSEIVGRKIVPETVKNEKTGKEYSVVTLRNEESQKLADHNFKEYLSTLKK